MNSNIQSYGELSISQSDLTSANTQLTNLSKISSKIQKNKQIHKKLKFYQRKQKKKTQNARKINNLNNEEGQRKRFTLSTSQNFPMDSISEQSQRMLELKMEKNPSTSDSEIDEQGKEEEKNRNSNLPSNQKESDQSIKYCEEIYEYLTQKEKAYIPEAIKNRQQNCEFLRSKLVEWIFGISKVFKFKFQTAFLAINIVDRVFGKMQFQFSRRNLQLLAITALFMAGKYQEIMIPKVNYFAEIPAQSDIVIKKQDILHLQGIIIVLLDFDLSYVSPIAFIDLIGSKFDVSNECKKKAMKISVQAIVKSEVKCWRSSYLGWYSLFFGCPQLKQLNQFIRKNSNIEHSSLY